jgi:hypothetical protein
MSIKNPTLAHFRHFSQFRHLIILYFYIGANYAKQTQFSSPHNNVNSSYTKDYEENRRKLVMKKQTQFKTNNQLSIIDNQLKGQPSRVR